MTETLTALPLDHGGRDLKGRVVREGYVLHNQDKGQLDHPAASQLEVKLEAAKVTLSAAELANIDAALVKRPDRMLRGMRLRYDHGWNHHFNQVGIEPHMDAVGMYRFGILQNPLDCEPVPSREELCVKD